MKWRKFFGLPASIVTLILPLVFTPIALAASSTATPLNLTISPALVNLVAKPGQTVTTDLRVKNGGAQTEKVHVDLLKFGANGDSGQPQLMERGPSDDYFNWAHFSENNFTVEPNVWMTIRMTVMVPATAGGGYYYAAVFSRQSPTTGSGGQSAIQGGSATLALLDVEAPSVKHSTKIASFTASRKFYEFLPATFTVKLRNDGDVHLAPVGSIFIKRGSSRVDLLGFNTAHGNILPHTNRVFTVAWQNGFPVYTDQRRGNDIVADKHGQPVKKLSWNFNSSLSKIRFGHYTADLLAVYDDGQQDVPIEATVSFWVIPWRLLGIVLLAVLFGGAGVWVTTRGIWKKFRKSPLRSPKKPTANE